MNINEFLKKFPNKGVFDYYIYLNNQKSNFENTFETNNNLNRPTFLSDINSISSLNEEIHNIENTNDTKKNQKPKSAIFFSIITFLVLLLLNFLIDKYLVYNNSEITPDKFKSASFLANEARECWSFRNSSPEAFNICQKDINKKASELNSEEYDFYLSEIQSIDVIQPNKNILTYVPQLLNGFVFCCSIGIIFVMFFFITRIELQFNFLQQLNHRRITSNEISKPIAYDFETFSRSIKLWDSKSLIIPMVRCFNWFYYDILRASFYVPCSEFIYSYFQFNYLSGKYISPFKYTNFGFYLVAQILILFVFFSPLLFYVYTIWRIRRNFINLIDGFETNQK